MKYIFTIIVSILFLAVSLTSCGGNDAAMNNGSDTGVAGRVKNDVMDDIERGIDDVTDGTIFDANGDHSNVDEYQANGDYSADTDVADNGTAYDYSYDSYGTLNNDTINY
jgi:hypothetical protein